MAYSGPSEIDPAHIVFNIHTDKIGEGKFGSVFRGRCHECVVAIKIPKRQSLSARDLEKFRREVNIMSRINHPNVCLFMGACTMPERIYIVTELLKCDLERVLKSPDQIALSIRMKWAKDAATGMAWLHGNNPAVLHRDLKTSNLLMGDNDIVKVCDFGLSQFQQEGLTLRDSSPKGTPLYMAPEVIMQREITPKVDVYAFGIIVWEILTRTEAFSHHNDINRFAQAICRHRERPPIPSDTPDSLRQLMVECWDHDPHNRPTFEALVPRLELIAVECERLEALMRIDHRIRDLNGRILWKENFLSLNAVPWDHFVRTLCYLIHFPLPDDISKPNEHTRQIYALKALLIAERESDEVTLQQFGKVLGWFGPLEPVHSEGAFLDRVADLLQHDWFHGGLKTDNAEALLITQPPGTFLFRFSSQQDSFALSHVSSQNLVQHHLIRHVPGSGFELHGRVFDSLQSIVVQEAKRYGLVDHVRCNSYAWIFNAGGAQTLSGYQAMLVR